MDITELMNLYESGETSVYHARMLLKVLLYAYCIKIYTGRKIARALGQDIHFFWLSGMSRLDFRTINTFRSSKAKEVIEVLNTSEDFTYGNNDLEEYGSQPVSQQVLASQIDQLNEKIKNISVKKTKRKAQSLGKQLVETADRIEKYEQQILIAGSRSGYNVTDQNASAMMMKNKVEVLPAYNVLADCEDRFITGVSLHQNTNDGTCFKDHLDQLSVQQSVSPEKIIADSTFGTEENYELLENKGINNYLIIPQFHNEQKKSYKNNPLKKKTSITIPLPIATPAPISSSLLLEAAISIHIKNRLSVTYKGIRMYGLHWLPILRTLL